MSEEIVARYLSRLAHDIRNCSGLFQLNLQMLSAEVDSNRGRACIEDAEEAISRLDTLANHLSQTLNPSVEPSTRVNVRSLAGARFAAAQERRTNEGASFLDVDFQTSGDSRIETSPSFLQCVLDVLFDNALDALETLESRGWLRVEVMPATLRVSNSGPPIADLEQIFKPFCGAAHHARFRAGLGLTRAARFAERVGAVIRADNASEGPVFTVSFVPTPE